MRGKTSHKTVQPPSFLHSLQPPLAPSQAMEDSGACASIIDGDTIRSFQMDLDHPKFWKAEAQQVSHWFGDSSDEHQTLFAIKIPFMLRNTTSTLFEVTFDVIRGKIPALTGSPTLQRFKAKINFRNKHFGLIIGQFYKSFVLNISHTWHYPLNYSSYNDRRVQLKCRTARSHLVDHRGLQRPERCAKLVPWLRWRLTATVHRDQNQLPVDMKIGRTCPMSLIFNNFKNIHLHLRNGSETAIAGYLRLVSHWSSTLVVPPNEVIRSCSCVLYTSPTNHTPVSSSSPPCSNMKNCRLMWGSLNPVLSSTY